MRFVLLLSFSFIYPTIYGQSSRESDAIVEEGKLLYRLERTSWLATDILVENYPNLNDVGGYFSYPEGEKNKCVFYSRAKEPKVLYVVEFSEDFNPSKVITEDNERSFSNLELDLFTIRNTTVDLVQSGDDLFKFYENTNYNFIPLIKGKEKKVYILTGPKQNGVIILGNDYLIEFDKRNRVKDKRNLHNNIQVFEYGEEGSVGAVHSHNATTGDYITATDICTLMLYAEYAGWEQHTVVSQKYMNIWNCKTNSLIVIPNKSVKKIVEDQEERNKDD